MTILTLARDLQTLKENEAQFEQLEMIGLRLIHTLTHLVKNKVCKLKNV